MTSLTEELRAEAKRRKGEVVVRKVHGWTFCLSYGAVDPRFSAEAAQAAGVRIEHRGTDVTDEVIALLRSTEPDDTSDADEEWMLSARIYPPGRSPTEGDWRYLGHFLTAIGVPPDSFKPMQTVNATIYWCWRDA
jgi:hypothetical protein